MHGKLLIAVTNILLSYDCNSWKPIMDHIDSKYDEYLNAESRVTRGAQLDDHRVHCCLYFITPSGHGLVVMTLS